MRSYNAGPGRIRQLQPRRKRGLDPNVWFATSSASPRSGSARNGHLRQQHLRYYIAAAAQRSAGSTRSSEGGRRQAQMNTQCDMDRETSDDSAGSRTCTATTLRRRPHAQVDRAGGTPASAQLMTKPQVANLIKNVENGVDEFRNYLEKRATTPATPPRSMREDIRGALASHT